MRAGASRNLDTVLLALDTSTPRVTVALHDGERTIATYESDEPMRHGELLGPGIAAVLAEAGAISRDVTAVAVGVGPGPFTGLRVGLVTARTFAFALEIPVYGVCSLDILAAEAVDAGLTEFVVVSDARRKEIYFAEYADGVRTAGPIVAKPDTVATELPALGLGAVLYPEAFPGRRGPDYPAAAMLADVVAGERFELLDPDPLYLRRPDATVPGPAKRVS